MVQQARHGESTSAERIGLTLFIAGVDLVEVHFRKVAVEVGTKNFATGIESITAQSVIELSLTHFTVVCAEPTARFVPALIAIDLDKFLTQFRRLKEIGVRACDRFRGELNSPFPRHKLLGDGGVNNLFGWASVIHAGVVCHAKRIPLGVDSPIPLTILLPKIVLR